MSYELGVAVPFMETCPSLSVLEVFEREGAGQRVWGEDEEGEDWPEKTVHLFVCFVVDALYRTCQFSEVSHLWEVLVASDPQHAVLFCARCSLSDVMVRKYFLLFSLVMTGFSFIVCELRGGLGGYNIIMCRINCSFVDFRAFFCWACGHM